MRRHVTIAIVMILCIGHFTYIFGATNEEMIEAFKNDAVVQSEVNNVRNRIKPNQEEFTVIPLGGGCGVRGCSFKDLVVMKLTRKGTNSKSTSVLAVVDGFATHIKTVTLVDMKPILATSENQIKHGDAPIDSNPPSNTLQERAQ